MFSNTILPSQKCPSSSKSAADLLQLAIIKAISGCVRIACSDLMVACMMQGVCCKLQNAVLMQIVVHRLDASCKTQTCCTLSSTDLMQVAKCRPDAISANRHYATEKINSLYLKLEILAFYQYNMVRLIYITIQ